jgi:spore coat polysaccharide biosynthesis predicted glycosyltransferase SpsG
MKRAILFRVDGGKVWGTSMGHVKRALLLAENLRDKYDVVFIMKNYADGVGLVKKRDFEVSTIAIDDNKDKTLIDFCEKYKPAKLIVDLHSCPYSTAFEYARSKNIGTIAFDIAGKFSAGADILINDSFVKDFTGYSGLPGMTKRYIGPEYFIMEEKHCPVHESEYVKNIMITMGGSDPAGLTVRILRSMPEDFFKYRVSVVLGPLFTDHVNVSSIAKTRSSLVIHDSPGNFIDLLNAQDVVITAAGRTLYECAFLGKPVITVPSIEHEEITAREYSALTGSADVGSWEDAASPGKLLDALEAYNNDSGLRNRVSAKSRDLVDGRGLKRVLQIIG